MKKTINMSGIENIDINDVLKEHSRDMFDGILDEIILGSKGSLRLKLQVFHQSEYINFIVLNIYDSKSANCFQYSYPIEYEDEETDWKLVNKFYNEWKHYFNTWDDELEKELIDVCGFK